MTTYFLFDVHEVHDTDKGAEYRGQVFATVEVFDGTYRILGGQPLDAVTHMRDVVLAIQIFSPFGIPEQTPFPFTI